MMLTDALAAARTSPTLVAVTVHVPGVLGAVNVIMPPPVMLPQLALQRRRVSLVPVTVAVKVREALLVRSACGGVIVTTTAAA